MYPNTEEQQAAIKDNNRFIIFEEWETLEDLTVHVQSHRFRVLLGSKSLLRQPMEIKYYSVSKTEGIEVINAVKNQ